MGNVLRVIVIVLVSLAMGVAGLFLLAFTVCGGLSSRDGVGVFAVCLVVILGGMGITAFLALGLDGRRSGATSLGLAVPPSIRSAPGTDPPAAAVSAPPPLPPAPVTPPKAR